MCTIRFQIGRKLKLSWGIGDFIVVPLAMVFILIPLKRNVRQASNLSERFVGIKKQLTKNNISRN